MKSSRRHLTAFVVACAVALAALPAAAFSITALFAPSAELWERWLTHDANAKATIDHGPWDNFLQANVFAGDDGRR